MGLEILLKSSPEVRMLKGRLKLEEKGLEFVKGFMHSEASLEPDMVWLVAGQAEEGKRYLFEFNKNFIDYKLEPSDFPEYLLFGSFEKADSVYKIMKMWLKYGINNMDEKTFKNAMLFVGESVKQADNSLKKWKERTGKSIFDEYFAINFVSGQLAGTTGFILATAIPEWASYSVQGVNPLVSIPLLSMAFGIWLGHKIQKDGVLSTYKNSIKSDAYLANAIESAKHIQLTD